MDHQAQGEAFVQSLLRARTSGVPAEFPSWLEGIASGEAYALQEQHARGLHGDAPRVGWKLGGAPATVAAFGRDAPLTGPLHANAVFASPARFARDRALLCAVEPELGVRFGRAFRASPSREELLEGIAEVFPAIEIADSRLARWRDAPPAVAVADLAFVGAFVRGTPACDWRGIDWAALPVTLEVNGEAVAHGNSAQPYGDPLDALQRFVRDLLARGHEVPAGTLVSAGSCAPAWFARAGDEVRADFGPLGSARVSITG